MIYLGPDPRFRGQALLMQGSRAGACICVTCIVSGSPLTIIVKWKYTKKNTLQYADVSILQTRGVVGCPDPRFGGGALLKQASIVEACILCVTHIVSRLPPNMSKGAMAKR